MRTRQSSRKPINLPGRYVTGLGEPQDVTLCDLSTGGCRFELGQRKLTLGSPIQIMVAGTGPHRAIVKWLADGDVGLTFVVPIPQEQFEGFQGSHIPEPSQANAQTAFGDISNVKPQRFC